VSIADVLGRLDGVRRTRRGWSARCPSHRDRSPSLSIAEGIGGRLLLHCHAGCEYDAIAVALKLQRSVRPAVRRPRLAVILDQAHRQPWAREDIRLTYIIADAIRHHRQHADRLRRAATAAGDTEHTWDAAAIAADLDREAERIAALVDEALR
jgi:hypothetical protein